MKTTPNNRFKQFMDKSGLRKEAVAAELNLSISLLQKIEAGQKEISSKFAEALHKRYQLPVDWLMDGIGTMEFKLEENNPWKDEAFIALKDEVKFYRQLLLGGKVNFLHKVRPTG